MIVGRKLKRNIFIDTDLDCQNCGSWQRVCTWNGECDNLEPMTNEEYLKSLDTEQLAKVLLSFCQYPCEICKIECDDGNACTYNKALNTIVEWLKQPHTPKE